MLHIDVLQYRGKPTNFAKHLMDDYKIIIMGSRSCYENPNVHI